MNLRTVQKTQQSPRKLRVRRSLLEEEEEPRQLERGEEKPRFRQLLGASIQVATWSCCVSFSWIHRNPPTLQQVSPVGLKLA